MSALTRHGELILPVPGFEAFYAASSHGRVFSLNYRRTGRMVELAQSILTDKRRTSETHYRRAKMYHIDTRSPTAVHIVIARTFVENPTGLPQVNHKDGDKGNNWASNLEWTDNSGNQKHAAETGLRVHPKGEEHPLARLTCEQVMAIRNELAAVPKHRGQQTDLARRYGVTNYCIFDIEHRKSWSHIA